MKRQMKWAAAVMAGCLAMQGAPTVVFGQSQSDTKNIQNTQNTQNMQDTQSVQEAFDAFLDKIYVEWISENPFQIHFYLEHPEDYGIEISSYTIIDYNEYDEDALAAYEQQQEEELAELKSFDKNQLTEHQQLLFDKLMEGIALNEKYADMFNFSSLIGGSNGVVNSLANNFQNYLFVEKKDIEDYLKFLQDIPNYINYIIDYTEEDAEYDLVPSKYMLQVNLEAIEELIGGDTNVFIEGFEQKLAEAAYLSDEERAQFRAQNSELVEQVVNPAFETLKNAMLKWKLTFIEWEGIGVYEEGEQYYNYLIESYAGVSMDAEELYEYLGGKLDETLNRYSELLNGNDAVYDGYVNSEYGFAQLTPTEILDALRVYTQENFAPIVDPGYQVKELPSALRSDGILAYYLTTQNDNNTINEIYLNPDTLDGDQGMLYETLAHEGYPGHLYYFNYIEQQGWHPMNSILSNSGFEEGWAEYASRLSLDSWGLDADMMEVVFLDQEINYLLSALTDIGINYGTWTIDDVFDLWNSYYYLDSTEDVRDIYDSCIADPASILSYPVGYFQICDLENDVKELLGDSFHHDEFVKMLLDVGGASFDLTREYVMRWASEL